MNPAPNGQTRQTDRQIDRQTDRCTCFSAAKVISYLDLESSPPQIDRTDRQIDRHIDRQINRLIYRQTDKQIDRQTDRCTCFSAKVISYSLSPAHPSHNQYFDSERKTRMTTIMIKVATVVLAYHWSIQKYTGLPLVNKNVYWPNICQLIYMLNRGDNGLFIRLVPKVL